MKLQTLINKLQKIASLKKDSIRKEVAISALKTDGFIISFFMGLRIDGSQSGMVETLRDPCCTHPFFDKYQEEINELTKEPKEKINTPLIITWDIKTSLAWFAFDEIAYRLSLELGLEA